MSSAQSNGAPFKPAVTVFMLVKTLPEWLSLPADLRSQQLKEQMEPILHRYKKDIRLRLYDVEFYSTRVTDIWLWEARDHHAYQSLVEDLRETPFWDRYFSIVEILPGVENGYAMNAATQPIAG
jgi:hypothetical protein